MFTGLTPEICARAWDALLPSLRHAADTGLVRDYLGGLALLNPASPDGPPLFTAHIGEGGEEFVAYAEAKARVAHRTGVDTTTMRDLMPHLYQPGDIKWPGGVVRDGLAVGFSGVEGEYDQMIAEWFISAVRAICRVQFHAPDGGEASQPTPYLGRSAAKRT